MSQAAERSRLGRLRMGEAIYLAAAILLFVLMFLPWYGVKASSAEPLVAIGVLRSGGDAWQALAVIPIFLMLAIAVAVGAALLRVSGSDWKPAVPPGAAVCALGLLAAALILFRIVSPPGDEAFGAISVESTLKPAIFLALAAALGIAYGGWRTMGEEGTSFAAIAKRLESPRRPPRPRSSSRSEPSPGPDSSSGPKPSSGPKSSAGPKS